MKLRRRRPRRKPQYQDLADYIAKTGDTQARIAALVGTSQATISRVAHGGRLPRALLAYRLAEYASIPLDSFTRNHLKRIAQVSE